MSPYEGEAFGSARGSDLQVGRSARKPRVAIVHEWFDVIAGSEKVVEQLCLLYPEADLFAVYADPEVVAKTGFLQGRKLQTTFLQKLPQAKKRFRQALLLMPMAIEQLDVSAYDIVISSSHAVSKGVLTGPDQLHVSYVHSPIRYAWDLQHQYLREASLTSGPKAWVARWMLHKVRIWDHRTAAGVDRFVANSAFIARRIEKAYGRRADVIYPPVAVHEFEPGGTRESFYLAASRMVPYKKMDLIAEAFARMPDRQLVMVGDGPELQKVREKAGPNVQLLGHEPFEQLRDLMRKARAFVFAAEEDFGIMPVEVQACGAPVIAYGRGGARETVRPVGEPGATGVFFDQQTPEAVCAAVERFEATSAEIRSDACRDNALRFSEERFREEFAGYLEEAWGAFCAGRVRG